ncbi:Holliday junction branch migration protein RuvA [Candidatus Woesebacteria bacterium]|nr:Holliday junction branch migration protein RuvA [Candidatus Woesebacteria bacterium]
MIGKIKGQLVELNSNIALIETPSGLFYNIYLTSSILFSLPPTLPHPIEIYTHLHVREDALTLFGFSDKKEHKIFLLLLDVPGVGAKSAFNIVSHIKVDELVRAVQQNDAAFFTSIKGLGKKTALKIILELSAKFDAEFTFEEIRVSPDDATIIGALVSLGFEKREVQNILPKLDLNTSMEERIKEGIKLLTN